MPQYNYQTGQYEETDEERQIREAAKKAAGTTVVGETKVKEYQDGSQTKTVTQEVPAPSFGDRLGQAFTQAGTNFMNNVASAPDRFVNNLNRGIEGVRTAPDRFMQNMQAMPAQMQSRLNPSPVAPAGFQGQTDEFGGVDAAVARQAAMAQAQPVAPAAQTQPAGGGTFDRMIQAESGGRQTDAQGRVLTSPKGAMGIAQVMPATAMDPGYGVTNIFDLAQQRGIPVQTRDRATAEQLLSNRALNQEFGANYYAAMNKRFDGGPAGVAAYNAGPGRVQQNMQANAGQLNVAQLPQETQGYLQKVGMPTPAAPAAQAPAQAAPALAQATPISPYSLATGQSNQGIRMPGAQPGTAPAPTVEPTIQAANAYQAAQDNTDALFKLGFDENQPEYIRQRAKDRVMELYDQQKKLAQATKETNNLTPKQAADAIQGRSKSGVGDWLQYLLLKHVGLNDLANEKGEQLGIGQSYQNATIVDDKGVERSVEILTSARGKALGGNFTGPNGAPLSQDQLEQAAGGILGKGVHVSKVENVVNPASGERIQEQTLSNGKIRYRKGGSAFTGDTSQFQNANAYEKDQDQRSNAANSFLNKNYPAGATDQQKLSAFRQAGVHPRNIETMMGMPEGTLTGEKKPATTPAVTAQPSGAVPKPTPAKEDIFAPVTQRVGETTADFKTREAGIEAKKKPLIKSVAEPFINKSAGIESTLTNIRLAIDALDSGDHNIGPVIAGKDSKILPGVQQAVGGAFGTKASENTKLINSFMSEAGLKNIKDTMGPSISNFDIQTKLKQMPAGERSNPDAVRAYLLREYNSIYNQAQRAKDITERLNMIEPGTVNLGPAPSELVKKPKEQESAQPTTSTTSSGNKYKRVQ